MTTLQRTGARVLAATMVLAASVSAATDSVNPQARPQGHSEKVLPYLPVGRRELSP